MDNLSIFCADVGSIKNNKFGWAASISMGADIMGNSIEDFAENISDQIRIGKKVALGFECPLFVPMREKAEDVNAARKGEGNRSWSAGAGTGALATGLVEVLWVMNKINKILGFCPTAEFEWAKFLSTNSVFLWEAFVTSAAKGSGHSEDAQVAVSLFKKALPNPWAVNAIETEEVFSLVGAAALRSGWAEDIRVLSQQCLVIKG